jgi:antitoxin component of RelBE/YafQ-DinJ toxin-antitoxin module
MIRVTDRVTIPNPTLSEYLKLIEKKVIKPEVLPFEVTIKFINVSLTKGDTEEELVNKFNFIFNNINIKYLLF